MDVGILETHILRERHWTMPGYIRPFGLSYSLDTESSQLERRRAAYRPQPKSEFTSGYNLRDQSRAAAVSSMGNIAEARGRCSFEEKRKFSEVSHGAVEELQRHLDVAPDQDCISQEELDEAYNWAVTEAGVARP